MQDNTESIRRTMVGEINGAVESNSDNDEYKRLSEKYGLVWDTEQLSKFFSVEGFMAPFITVVRKSDNKKGTLMFQHHPRFYFDFREAS